MKSMPQIHVTLFLGVLVLFLQALPGFHPLLELDWKSMDWWKCYRVFTCHWLHWSWNHMVWDLAMFVLLGSLCEIRDRRRYLQMLAVSSAVIPLFVMTWHPELTTYRGLSGLDSGLFAFLALDMMRERLHRSDRRSAFLFGACLAGLGIKIVWEVFAGGNIFVSDASFVPVPLAHLVGGVVGCAMGCSGQVTNANQSSSSPIVAYDMTTR
jgi:rhomboid family GlyGly-CTERM serine protease